MSNDDVGRFAYAAELSTPTPMISSSRRSQSIKQGTMAIALNRIKSIFQTSFVKILPRYWKLWFAQDVTPQKSMQNQEPVTKYKRVILPLFSWIVNACKEFFANGKPWVEANPKSYWHLDKERIKIKLKVYENERHLFEKWIKWEQMFVPVKINREVPLQTHCCFNKWRRCSRMNAATQD